VCYITKLLKDVFSPNAVSSIYSVYFHSNLKYGLIFSGGDTENKVIFELQKQLTQIFCGVGSHISCKQLYIQLNVHPLASVCATLKEI
jgi:hypothetical protein